MMIIFSDGHLETRTQATHLIKAMKEMCHPRHTSSYNVLLLFTFKQNWSMPTKFKNPQYKISRK
jgi:hypothetical protein